MTKAHLMPPPSSRPTGLSLRWGSVLLLGLLATLFALPACGGNKERIVQEKIAERVSEFRKKETEKCQATLLADAERIVDSLLLYGALEEVNDSLRNRHPFKPVKPAHIAPMDSLPVKPIFDSTGGF